MTVGNRLTIVVVVAALGALLAPAFAQSGATAMPRPPDHGMSMGHRSRGMMSDGMMGGCAEMMQSMNNGGNGKPNSQWRTQPRPNPKNGG